MALLPEIKREECPPDCGGRAFDGKRDLKGKGREGAMEANKVKREPGTPAGDICGTCGHGRGISERLELDEKDKKMFPLHLLPPLPTGERAAAAFPTPDATPLASTSSSFVFPASPTSRSNGQAASTIKAVTTPPPSPPRRAEPASPPSAAPPASPSRQHDRLLIPLDHLVPVGTIRLDNHVFLDETGNVEAEDGWVAFAKDTLRALPPPRSAAAAADQDEHLPSPPSPTAARSSPKKGKAKAGIKRKAPPSSRPSPAKKAKACGHIVLDSLISLSAALGVRATVRVVGTLAILRIYLIPQDQPELADPAYSRGKTKRPPGSTVFQVLNAVRMSGKEWGGEVDVEEVPRFMDEQDHRSLLEVYRDIESPSHDDAFIDQLDTSNEIKERLRWALAEGVEGVETDMFPYQRATLAKMLARELAPQPIPHPAFIRCTSSLDTSCSVFVSLEGAVRNKPLEVVEPKGGILAEDMGVGKTLIVLSLILSTLNELPKLEGVSTYLDDSLPSPPPVLLTNVSLDFPFPAEIGEAKKLRPRVPPPLAGYMMDAWEEAAYLNALARQAEEDARIESHPLPSLRSLMVHHIKTSPTAIRYPVDDIKLQEMGLLDLLQNSPPFYRVFPSPDQLDSREGRKGRHQRTDIVVAATTLVVVPTDLVRQWMEEIRKHAPNALRVLVLRTAKDNFKSAVEMATYDLILMSVARFSDAADADDTSLRGVHWRRLIVDEGHTLSSANRMRKLAEELRCESRWAVSGTPSTNLRGAQEGAEGALFASASAAGGDRVDLDRLGQLFSRFVQHPAFPRPDSLRKLVQTHVLVDGERPYRLSSVLDRAVIRHDHSLIKQSFSLPPLTSRVVYIEMEEAERRTYNALVALFSSNSITSQRVDQDYLFHPQQRKHLDTLCDNLACASFFFGSGELFHQLSEARDYVQKRLNSASSVKWTEEERAGLLKTVGVYSEVLEDRESQLTAGAPGVAFEVEGLNPDLASPFLALSASKNPRGRLLVSQSQLVRLRVNLRELRREDVKGWDDDEELVEELITFEEKRKRLEAVPKGQAPAEMEDPSLFKKRGKKDVTPVVPLPEDSCFKDIRLVRTTSAKINYIVGELLRYPDEKFIIFSSSIVDIVFANLSETLDLLGIRHAIFAGSHARADRGLTAQRFNSTTAKECQAILVDAKLGGRGITLTAASRVICVEPVWSPDLEAQAAKRAHRLGQKKPVDMQTLVVKGTYEDALLRRRSELAPEDFAKKVKVPQQDNQLRSLLQAAQYLEPAAAAKEGRPVSKPLEPAVRLIRD